MDKAAEENLVSLNQHLIKEKNSLKYALQVTSKKLCDAENYIQQLLDEDEDRCYVVKDWSYSETGELVCDETLATKDELQG